MKSPTPTEESTLDPKTSEPPVVEAKKPTPSRTEIRRAQLAAEEKTRARNARLQNLVRGMDSARDLFSELEQTARLLRRLSARFQEAEPILRQSRDVDLATRIGYRAVCSAVFGSTQMIQSVLKYKNRLNDVETDIREELESK